MGTTKKNRKPELTGHDLRWLNEHLVDLQDEDSESEVVMTSLGYVELWPDGDVVYHGTTIATLDADSCHTHCPVCGWPEEGHDHDECEEE